VEKKFLPDEGLRRKYFLKLADYFEENVSLERKSQELPWCLFHAKSWFRLRKALCNIDLFYVLCTKKFKFELKRYWNAILEDNNVAEAYIESLETFEMTTNPPKKNLAMIIMRAAKFLKEMLQFEGATKVTITCDLNEIIIFQYNNLTNLATITRLRNERVIVWYKS
jgi:hypothetical protein